MKCVNNSITLVLASALLLPAAAGAQDLVIDSAASPYVVAANESADSVTVVSGGILVVNATLTVVGDMTVEAGGSVTHDEGLALMGLTVGGRLYVQAGGAIDLSEKGLGSGLTFNPITQQPEAGAGTYQGGSHGGLGGNGPATYGDGRDPRFLGGGGGSGQCYAGGKGGGHANIQAGTLQVDGSVRADGGPPVAGCTNGGGGAGGSFLIDATTVTGSGVISASGSSSGTGGGGGGRVAIYCDTFSMSGSALALGGTGSPAGDFGSVYILVDGQDLRTMSGYASIGSGDSYQSVTIGPGGILTLNGAAAVTAPIALPEGSTVRLNDAQGMDALSLPERFGGQVYVNVPFTWAQNMTVDGSLIVNQPLTVSGDLTIESGGLVTHQTEVSTADISASGTIWVKLGGALNVDSRGLPPGYGIDTITLQPTANVGSYAGGSYGGRGGGGNTNPLYGDARDPQYLGAGGGGGQCYAGGRGGGRVTLDATEVRVDGAIHADGGPPTSGCQEGGGGAGGTVHITTTTLSGAGVITASGSASGGSGGGGGGRVRAAYDTYAFTGSIAALGGAGSPAGDQGTTYLDSSSADLTVANSTTTIGGGDSYNSITLLPGAVLIINGPATVAEQVLLPAGSTVVLEDASAMLNLSLPERFAGNLIVNVPFTWEQNMIVEGSLVLNEQLDVTGDITIETGATVTHDYQNTKAALSASATLWLKEAAFIDLDALGYPPKTGLDLGTLQPTQNVGAYAGGSHGGRGGGSSNPLYDDPRAPVYPGSGGGDGQCYGGGRGGGRIRISAETIRVDGTLRANGGAPTSGCQVGGGGAGGALLLDATTFTGVGIIAADGAGGTGGGGGGCIAIYYDTSTFTGSVSAAGGAGDPAGEVGTVYQESALLDLVARGGLTVIDETDSYNSITLLGGAVLDIRGAATVALPISIGTGSTVVLSASDGLDNLSLVPAIGGILRVEADSVFPEDINLAGTMIVNRRFQVPNLTTQQGAVITHTRGVTTMDLHVTGVLELVGGSFMDVEQLGYAPGPRAGFGNAGATIDLITLNLGAGSGAYNGGSHASLGGQHDTGQAIAAVYEDPNDPIYLGGGGGEGQCNRGGYGGGLIRATIGAFIHDGTIIADGGPPQSGCNVGGGGAAGTVRLVIGDWSGSGVITAIGGGGNGGGAGGVVRVSYATKSFSGPVTITGGGNTPGEDGFFIEDQASLAPAIISTAPLEAELGQTYTYLPRVVGTPPFSWSIDQGPADAAIDGASGELTWTPSAADPVTFTIRVENAVGADTQTFEVGFASAPLFTSTPTTTAVVAEPYQYDTDGRAEAVGSQPLVFSMVSGPVGFVINAQSGAVSWSPSQPGDQSVLLRVENAYGSDEQFFVVSVQGSGEGAPVIVEAANLFATVGQPYQYDEDGRADAVGAPPMTWAVSAGPAELHIDGDNGLVTWMPTTAGTVGVTIEATNALGSDTYAFEIEVVEETGPEPTPVATVSPTEGDAPLTVNADGSQSYSAPGTEIAFYRWDFGDGTALVHAPLATHTYERPGSYVARLRVADAYGNFAEKGVLVSVSDEGQRPPTARILVTSVEGSDNLEVSFSCNCSAGSQPIAGYLWDFGDGERSELSDVSHTFGPGGYQVRLTVVDSAGLVATDSVNIRVTEGSNQPPLIAVQGVPLHGPAPLEVAFSATFGDLDGEVTAVDWDFGDGTTAAATAPTHTYDTPGIYYVSVSVSDDQGLSSGASLEVEVSDAAGVHPPQILSIASTEAALGEPYLYDEDGLPAARGDRPLTWTLGKNVGGQVVGAPDGMAVDAVTGQITFTPGAAQIGELEVTLVVSNPAGAAAQEWVLTVTGEAPGGGDGGGAEDGCGCGAARDVDDAAWPALLAIGLLTIRRRRLLGRASARR